MKLYTLALLIPTAMAKAAPDDWKEIFRDKVARIEVEKAVYEKPKIPAGLFIHVRLTNLTTTTLGIDLSKRQNVVYLNQVGYYPMDHREVIDELRARGRSLTASEENAFRNAFAGSQLHAIQAGENVDYFVESDFSGNFDLHVVKGEHFILTVDGTLFLTDGQQVFRISLEKLMVEREVSIPSPPQFKTIPDNAIVIGPY